jgi:hypothetical protein
LGNVRTVWYFWKYSDSVVFFGNVRTMWHLLEMFGQCGIFWKCSDSVENTTLSEHFPKIPHCPNISRKYHTVRTFPKNTALSEHFQKIPHCPSISKTYHTVGTTVWYFLEMFRQCGMFWKCSDSVVFSGNVRTVWYFLEMFGQCGIFWKYSDSVVFFGKVRTVWYFLEMFGQCGMFKNTTLSEHFRKIPHCPNISRKYHTVRTFPKHTTLSEHFQKIPHYRTNTVWYVLEMFGQCGIFWKCSDSVVFFGNVPTVWYFLEMFRQCGIFWKCSDSVVFNCHTVGTFPKNTTLSEHFQKIPHCPNISKKYDSVVFSGNIRTVWYFLEMFGQCGIFWKCSDSVVCFGNVRTVWYFLEMFGQCGIFWKYSDTVRTFPKNTTLPEHFQ